MFGTDIPSVPVDEIPADALVLDCREHDEWVAGHIPEALHMPMNSIPQRLSFEPDALPPDGPIVVVCTMGGRSGQVTAWLNDNGYRAVNLDGGLLAWAAARRPLVSENGEPARVA